MESKVSRIKYLSFYTSISFMPGLTILATAAAVGERFVSSSSVRAGTPFEVHKFRLKSCTMT